MTVNRYDTRRTGHTHANNCCGNQTVEQKRKAIAEAYPGPDWPYKVKNMSDNQVRSVHLRLKNSNKL